MKQHKAIVKAEQWCKSDIDKLRKEIFLLKQAMFKKEELLWEQQRLLHKIQRKRIEQFKGLSENQQIALRSGLSLAEISLGKKLLREAKALRKEACND